MKLKTASLIAAIGCAAFLVLDIFLQFVAPAIISPSSERMIYTAAIVLGWGSLINFFLILYKNQK